MYVAGGGEGIAAFSRNAATGKLTQLPGKAGCISPDGTDEDGGDTCTDGRVVDLAYAVTLSPDERFLYANASWDVAGNASGVSAFERDAATGALTQLDGEAGCATTTGADEDGADHCLDVRGGGYASSFSIMPTGSTRTCRTTTSPRSRS